VVPIRLRGVHVQPVGEGLGHDGGEVAVEGCVLASEGAADGDGLLAVVADGVDVVDLAARWGLQPPVVATVVELDQPSIPGVVGVGVAAAGEIGAQVVRRVLVTVQVRVPETLLPPIGAGQPSEQVVEGAVLHHEDDDGVERASWGLTGWA